MTRYGVDIVASSKGRKLNGEYAIAGTLLDAASTRPLRSWTAHATNLENGNLVACLRAILLLFRQSYGPFHQAVYYGTSWERMEDVPQRGTLVLIKDGAQALGTRRFGGQRSRILTV